MKTVGNEEIDISLSEKQRNNELKTIKIINKAHNKRRPSQCELSLQTSINDCIIMQKPLYK